MSKRVILLAAFFGMFLTAPAIASENLELVLVRPDGIVNITPVNVLPHPDTLDGKTIALRWTHKLGGDILLTRVAELIEAEFPQTTVLRTWEMDNPLLIGYSESKEMSIRMSEAIADLRPDLVIGGHAD